MLSGDGPSGGALILSDAPTKNDYLAARAFGSKSGLMMRRWAAEVGLSRVRFDYMDGENFAERLAALEPKVIVACGARVLHNLTNYFDSIEDIHGYVLRDSLLTNAPVIPTFHPSDVLRQPSNAYWMKFALQKAKEVGDGKIDPPIEFITNNDFDAAMHYLLQCSHADAVSIDIETNKFNPVLTAIGIGYNDRTALSISPNGLTDDQWNLLLGIICDIIADPRIEKIGQNIMFDFLMLWKMFEISPKGEVWDTMHAANVLNCDIEKSLKALGRLYFYGAPWKGQWNTTDEKLRIYNAQDVGFTYRIRNRQKEDLTRHGLFDYFTTVRKMFIPSFDLASRGIKIDVEGRERLTGETQGCLAPLEEDVKTWAKPFVPAAAKKKKKRNPAADERVTCSDITALPKTEQKLIYIAKKKDLKYGLELGVSYRKAFKAEVTLSAQAYNPKSSKQCLGVLTNAKVKIPKVKKADGEWGESTNDKALAKIVERNTDLPEVINFVTKMRLIRQGNKLLTSYCKAPLDADNRWRCSYNVEGTETGRSSSKKTPWGTGGNNQNIPRDGFRGIKFKSLFIADDHKTLFQSDQEQAEARVVAYLARCKRLIDLFETGQDVHVYAINSILGEDIAKWKETDPLKFKLYRQYGKIVNHGGNYDMGPATLSENAVKQGITLSIKDATFFLAKRRTVFPEIYAIWHEEVKRELHKTRRLTTPFGRRRVFMGPITTNTYREAYAHVPQSTVPHITNLMWRWVEDTHPSVNVLQMGHDALLMQADCDKVDGFVKAFISQTRTITFPVHGTNVNIPWDAGIGSNWSELKKVKVN